MHWPGRSLLIFHSLRSSPRSHLRQRNFGLPNLWKHEAETLGMNQQMCHTLVLLRLCDAEMQTSTQSNLSRWTLFNPFTPKSDQCQISPAASPETLYHTVWRTWLFIAYSDERWLYYQFSPPHLYIWEVGRMYVLNLGVKGLNRKVPIMNASQTSNVNNSVAEHSLPKLLFHQLGPKYFPGINKVTLLPLQRTQTSV